MYTLIKQLKNIPVNSLISILFVYSLLFSPCNFIFINLIFYFFFSLYQYKDQIYLLILTFSPKELLQEEGSPLLGLNASNSTISETNKLGSKISKTFPSSSDPHLNDLEDYNLSENDFDPNMDLNTNDNWCEPTFVYNVIYKYKYRNDPNVYDENGAVINEKNKGIIRDENGNLVTKTNRGVVRDKNGNIVKYKVFCVKKNL